MKCADQGSLLTPASNVRPRQSHPHGLHPIGLFSSSRRHHQHNHLRLASKPGRRYATVLEPRYCRSPWQAGPHEAVWIRHRCKQVPAISACMRNKHFPQGFGCKQVGGKSWLSVRCPGTAFLKVAGTGLGRAVLTRTGLSCGRTCGLYVEALPLQPRGLGMCL